MAHSSSNVDGRQHFTYIWTIENMCEAIELLCSPTFTVNKMEMTKWYISMFIVKSESIGLKITRQTEDEGPEGIEIKFEISFLDGIEGKPLIERVEKGILRNGKCIQFELIHDKGEIFVRRRSEFLPKGELTIRCRMWRTGTQISQTDTCCARSRLRPDRHSFVWTVRDFSTLQSGNDRKILLKKGPTDELTFILFVTENKGKEYISIILKSKAFEERRVKISLLNFEGRAMHCQEITGFTEDEFKFKNFIEKSSVIHNKEGLLLNDAMSLRCEIEMGAKIVWSTIENYTYSNSKRYRVLASDEADTLYLDQGDSSNVSSSYIEDMKSLIEEVTFSDVTLRTHAKWFPAHKCILSARSPVFKDMFEDTKTDSVQIKDVNMNTLRELLSYIYTDKVGKLQWKRAVDLYIVADKYKVFDLKRRCATFLKSGLSASSVCAVLTVAAVHLDKELREAVKDFLMQQGAEFFKIDTWQNFQAKFPSLAADILQELRCSR